MQYEIIILTEEDVNFINNRAVICNTYLGLAIFEPIPIFLAEYFENRERIIYIPDWQNIDRPIRLQMNTTWLTQTMLIDQNLRRIINREIDANELLPENEKFIHISDIDTICYFFTISEEDAPFVQPYILSGNIKIDTK